MNTFELIRKAYKHWPEEVKYIFNRTKKENDWDDLTTYVQILFCIVWIPKLELYIDEVNEYTAMLPKIYKLKERRKENGE